MSNYIKLKIKSAEHFLKKLKLIENIEEQEKDFLKKIYLDCFLFELVSAKDLYLQKLRKKYNCKFEAYKTTPKLLKKCIQKSKKNEARKDLEFIRKLRALEHKKQHSIDPDKWSWLFRLEQYRNVSAHNALLSRHITIKLKDTIKINSKVNVVKVTEKLLLRFLSNIKRKFTGLFQKKKIKESKQSVPPDVYEYLSFDPWDFNNKRPYYKKELIKYCEDVFNKMKEFLNYK